MAVLRHDFKGLVAKMRAKQGMSTPKVEVLPAARRRGPFTTEAAQVWDSIASMRRFMHEQAATGRAQQMSTAERDEVDSVASEFLAVCSKRLAALKALIEHTPASPSAAVASAQHSAHMKAMLASLHEQLAALVAHLDSFREAFAEEAMRMRGRELIVPRTRDHTGSRPERSWEALAGCELDDELASLSAGERQQLEAENAELQAELSSMVDDVRLAETKMAEIAALSNTFASKLAEQSKSIEHIEQDTVAATEYVRMGNKSLESAERHGQGFRFYQLMFYVVAGLLLLLADWWYS
jgi:hypothetical protein